MNILGIETSCDETAAAVVQDGQKILSNVVVSQIDIFAEYGGVIPEIAARNHLDAILPVVNKALKDANFTWDDIDAIAVTHTPGLLGSLLIGTLTARTLAILHNKPLYAVHHLKSHIYANWLEKENLPGFPLLAEVISGGHTQILYMPAHNKFEIIGTTHDDAVGECFDKVAKILGLPYPGGPSIAKAAEHGDPKKYKFPHPRCENPLDFSFSGLKTAVLRAVQKELNLPISHPSHDLKNHLTDQQIADFAASFQKTAVDILLENLQKATQQYPDVKSIVFAGGVSANQALRDEANHVFDNNTKSGEKAEIVFSKRLSGARAREDFSTETSTDSEAIRTQSPLEKSTSARREQTLAKKNAISAFFPAPRFSGDNGAMVASAAFYEIQSGVSPTDPYSLDILPRSVIN